MDDDKLDALIREASPGGNRDLAADVFRAIEAPPRRRAVVSGPGMALAGFVLLLIVTPVVVAFGPGDPHQAAAMAVATGDAPMILGLGQ